MQTKRGPMLGFQEAASQKQFLLAFGVVVFALLGGLLAAGGAPAAPFLSSGAVGEALFQCLATDAARLALPATFARLVLPASANERPATRAAWATAVGAAAMGNLHLRSHGLANGLVPTLGVQAASYLLALDLPLGRPARLAGGLAGAALVALVASRGLLTGALEVAFCLGVAGCAWALAMPRLGRWHAALAFVLGMVVAAWVLLPLVSAILGHLMPVSELTDAFATFAVFVGSDRLYELTSELLLITVNIQVPLGFLGITFLRRAQERQNALLLVGEDKLAANCFVWRAVSYIIFIAIPYMVQRTAMENVNSYAFGRFAREIERSLRLEGLFPEGQDVLLSAVSESNFTVGGYAGALNDVASTAYQLVERKLFSLPKLTLLPGMLWSKPWLVATVLPASILLDEGKSQLMALLSNRIEDLSQEIQELANRRQRVELHDTRHQELIRMNAVADFAKARWRELSVRIAGLEMRKDALASVRGFTDWLYWQDMMQPGIECTLSFLLEMKHITNVDIWVYSRVVEDAIDTLLTRSRSQAELATMQTNLERLRELTASLAKARARGRARCRIDPGSEGLRFEDVEFARGPSLRVRIPSLTLPTRRIYAVTGPNGAGKSSAFSLLAGCGRRPVALPAGLELGAAGRLVLPSDDVELITQQLYCPLFVKPIAWMLQAPEAQLPEEGAVRAREERVAQLMSELGFHGDGQNSTALANFEELRAEKEDWYSELSGGQRVKVEFIRKVFLKGTCPKVLLLDEAFAPLDPKSKAVVQHKLKEFCSQSVVLAIYHSDAKEGCVRSGDFFDGSLHFENGTATLVETC